MNYLSVCCTAMGIGKKNNQDSLLVKRAVCNKGEIVLAVLCDGMGGLMQGEVASASLIRAFSAWFDQELPRLTTAWFLGKGIFKSWDHLLKDMNRKINEYGCQHHLQLGTTVTAMLFMGEKYYIAHVGDSRIYELGSQIRQLTKDQTLVEREVEQGILTPEQARSDPRQNVLLQCIGVLSEVQPEYKKGVIHNDFAYLLCCDGFRHMISSREIFKTLNPAGMTNENVIKGYCQELITLNKTRGEKDDISVIVIRTYREKRAC